MAGNEFVDVTWAPPTDTGGSAITGYSVTAYVAGAAVGWGVGESTSPTSRRVEGLQDGTAYQFSVRATNGDGEGPESPLSEPVTPQAPGPSFVPITGCRLLDTRAGGGPLRPGTTRTVATSGVVGCPISAEVSAVEATVTAVSPGGRGYVQAGAPGATATVVNFSGPWSTSNTGAIAVDPVAGLELSSAGASTDVVIDVTGIYVSPRTGPAGAVFVPVTACRVYDTRSAPAGSVGAGERRDLAILGVDGCRPPGAVLAVEATISAVNPRRGGFLMAWPTPRPGQPATRPRGATVLNFAPGRSTSNTAALGVELESTANLTIEHSSAGASDYTIDIQGWWVAVWPSHPPTGAVYRSIHPCRGLDTRTGGGPIGAGATRAVRVIGAGGCGIPDGAVAVEATITVVGPARPGFLRLGRAGGPPPGGTFLNFATHQSSTNTGAVGIDPVGSPATQLALTNHSASANHYVVDIQGYFVAAGV